MNLYFWEGVNQPKPDVGRSLDRTVYLGNFPWPFFQDMRLWGPFKLSHPDQTLVRRQKILSSPAEMTTPSILLVPLLIYPWKIRRLRIKTLVTMSLSSTLGYQNTNNISHIHVLGQSKMKYYRVSSSSIIYSIIDISIKILSYSIIYISIKISKEISCKNNLNSIYFLLVCEQKFLRVLCGGDISGRHKDDQLCDTV